MCSSYIPAWGTPIEHIHRTRSHISEENSSSPIVSAASQLWVEAYKLFPSLDYNVHLIVHSQVKAPTEAVCYSHFLYIGPCFTFISVPDFCPSNLSALPLLWWFLSLGKEMWYSYSICGWTLNWYWFSLLCGSLH